MSKYIITMPDDWNGCTNPEMGRCENIGYNECPLANVRKAVEITNSLSRALQTHDGVKIYAVDEREGK